MTRESRGTIDGEVEREAKNEPRVAAAMERPAWWARLAELSRVYELRGRLLATLMSGGVAAAMEAAASALGSELGLTIVNLATPSAWNPVSLTLTQRAREAGVRRRWRTSDARRSVALVSVVGGERDQLAVCRPALRVCEFEARAGDMFGMVAHPLHPPNRGEGEEQRDGEP